MTDLKKAKQVIKKHIKEATHGLFDCCNIMGDILQTIYERDTLRIDICYDYEYFEVFGLSKEDFIELMSYYDSLCLDIFIEEEEHDCIIEELTEKVIDCCRSKLPKGFLYYTDDDAENAYLIYKLFDNSVENV